MKPEDIEYLKQIYSQTKNKYEYLFHVELVNANIPLQYRHFEFDSFKNNSSLQTSIKIMLEYIENLKNVGLSASNVRGKGFYIFGNRGTAKTALACVFAKEIIRLLNYSVYFISYLELADMLKNGNGIRFEEYNFLIIDDFGNYDIPDFVADRFTSFLKTRYYRGNPSILTSFLSPQQISTIFGDGLYSLMFECFIFIDHTKVSDWRKKK